MRRFFLAMIVLGCCAHLRAQVATLVAEAAVAADEGQGENKIVGFSVLKEDRKHVEALQDFERYSKKGAWELAFKAITPPAEAELRGMVASKDGFMVPIRQRIRELLASMPPEGRQAYRLFHDARAKQLFEQAASKQSGDETAELRRIVDQFFVTSVGDQAANLLGDLYYERGDFVSAAAAWEMIIDGYPETNLNKARLHVKRAIALARAGRWVQFEQASRTVAEKFAGEKVQVGGKEVTAADYLSSYASTARSGGARAPDESQIALPAGETPAWQMNFADEEFIQNIRQQMNNMGWGWQPMGIGQSVPPAVTDGKRLFLNWLGIGFAIDVQSGKLAWRTDKFTDLDDKAQMIAQYGIDTDRYAIALAQDHVLLVRVPLAKIQNRQGYPMSCHEAQTGKQRWTSESGSLSKWSFIGPPVLAGGSLYSVAHQQGNQEMHLVSIELKTGRQEWTISLGTPQASNNYRGELTFGTPSMVHNAGTLYVLTNNGALLAVNIANRRLDWALTYEMPPVQQNNWWGYQQMAPEMPGVMVMQGGVLYIKEAKNGAMYAVDMAGPSLKWKRPVNSYEMIAQIDDRHMYFMGTEVSGMEIESRELKWSTRLPQNGQFPPLLSGRHLYTFLARGIFQIDTTNGNVERIFRGSDKDGGGGRLLVADGKLISVSNVAVTGYELGSRQARLTNE